MSRRKLMRQKPLTPDRSRSGNGPRACATFSNVATSGVYLGSKFEINLKEIDSELNAKLRTDDNSIDKRREAEITYDLQSTGKENEYVTLVPLPADKVGKDRFSLVRSENEAQASGRKKKYISPVGNTHHFEESFSDESGVYVTLRGDSFVSDDVTEINNLSHTLEYQEQEKSGAETYLNSFPTHQSERLTARVILEPISPQLRRQRYLKIETVSDSESVVSAEINRSDYFKQLKEFEDSIERTEWKGKLDEVEDNNEQNFVQQKFKCDNVSGEYHDKGGNQLALDESGLRTETDTRKGSDYDDLQAMDESENNHEYVTVLEDVIQDFLQYFNSKRHSMRSAKFPTQFEKESDERATNETEHGTEGLLRKPEMDKDTDKEHVSKVPNSPKSVDAPTLPPRCPRGERSSANSENRGNHELPASKNRETHSSELHHCDIKKTLTSRSPSARKRDIMMRRYNSTSVLPMVTPVDMNKNHIMHSRDDYFVPTNGHNDNDVTDCSVVNGNQSNLNGNQSNISEEDNEEHTLVHMDIVGESYEARYPWQRDISTQCDLSGYRNSVSSGSVSSGSDWSNYTAANNQNCSNYVNANCVTSGTNPARRQSSDNIRRRHHVFRTRRPRSMTCLESNTLYNSNSDMYPSDTNLNHRRGRTSSDPSIQNSPNRKRMPLLVADDPGSVSDLESILENPHDGNNSFGEESVSTDLSGHLRRLEEVRDSLASATSEAGDPEGAWSPSLKEKFRNVLPSPRISPEMWNEVPEVVVNTERDDYDPGEMLRSMNWNSNLLSVPRKPQRRLSSGSLHSGSDESDNEIAPPVARRGRRAAIVDTKNFGDVSPTTLSPEVSPSNSCDEGESGSNIAERLRRRRSSHDVSMNVYPGDLLVQEHHKKLIKRNTISDFYAGRNGSTPALSEDNKKQRQPFSLLKLMKTRSKESLHLSDVLKELKPSEFKDNHLAAYKNVHWTDLIASTDKQSSVADTLNISETERKRRESVWELFKSECVFLIDHLMVLKHCFLEPLKKCQVEGFLMYAEPSEIFSNLDELCYVSYTFCKDFISSLLKDMSATDFGSTAVLIKAFQRFSKHSKDGSVYHTYCLNYTNALSYLEKLRKNDDFCEFEKWCEQDQRCNRLQLADLLIGPMQHCTKLPLLLHNIQKYTADMVEKTQIVESIEKVEMSLRQLEEKMKWLKNFERVQEIQRHLIWPPITDLDSRAFIPEYLKPKLSRQPCERLLACPSRQLIHEGAVTLTESAKSFDAYMFLFDDILLITKTKKPNRKKQSSSDIHSATGQSDNQMYTVHRQPIALDRLGVHDVLHHEAAANGLKCAFVIVQISRFQQIIDVFTLQSPTEAAKVAWISQILDAKARCQSCSNRKGNSSKENEDPSPTNCGKKGRHGKSLSIDAVFL